MSKIYTVWYMKPDFFSFGIMGCELPAKDLSSHVKVKEFKIEYAHKLEGILNWIYSEQQAHNWSPNGEARSLIERLGLSHTSMSVGDVIQDNENRFWMVANVGFKELKPPEWEYIPVH